jgi:hypothetical protein
MFHHLISNAVKFRKGEMTRLTLEATIIKQNRFRSVEE